MKRGLTTFIIFFALVICLLPAIRIPYELLPFYPYFTQWAFGLYWHKISNGESSIALVLWCNYLFSFSM